MITIKSTAYASIWQVKRLLSVLPDSAKFKGIKTVKNHDDTAFYVCFGVIENFTQRVKSKTLMVLRKEP